MLGKDDMRRIRNPAELLPCNYAIFFLLAGRSTEAGLESVPMEKE